MGYAAEPEESNFEPWATTNMDYGKFYSFYKPELVKRSSSLHAECERRYEMLLKELADCKAQLDQLRNFGDPAPGDDGPPSQRSDVSCEDQEQQRNASPNKKHHQSDWHPSDTPSPRLSDLQNETSTEQQQETRTEVTNKDSRSRVTIKPSHRKPRTERNRDQGLSRPKTAPVRHLDYLRSSRGKPDTAHPVKYDHYKYFGKTGQGAKSSNGAPQVPPLNFPRAVRRRPQY